MLRKIRVLFILHRYWKVFKMANIAVNDPKSNSARILTQDMSMEEIVAIQDLEVIHRFFSLPVPELKKELTEIEKSLTKIN